MFRNPCHRIKMKSELGSRRNLRCWPEIVLRLCVARGKERQVTRVLKCSCRLFSIINSKSDPRFRPLFFFGATAATHSTRTHRDAHITGEPLQQWQPTDVAPATKHTMQSGKKEKAQKYNTKKKCWWRSSAYLSLVFIFFVLPVSSTPLSQTHTPHSADYEIKIVSVSVVVDPRNRCVFEYILQRWLVIPFAHIQGVSQVHLKKPPWQIDKENPSSHFNDHININQL